ncbi:DUF2254 domain-containing protein [Loktanella sp. IMCC34160]|nr:DUF2254 domain-containing protein [Loktanella sp. IMCC34160]
MGGVAVLALGLARLFGWLIPGDWNGAVSGEATDRLLAIMANALLAVTTFSLTVMVTVFRSSATQFTPRVHRLIMEDTVTQKTLAAFVGAYVYSLCGIILRELDIFGDDRSLVLFATTVLMLGYVVVSIIRWIVHLQTFGSLAKTLQQVEDMVRLRLQERLDMPCLGANVWPTDKELPREAKPVRATESGYICEIFQEGLNAKARAQGWHIYLPNEIGDYISKGDTIAYWVAVGDGAKEADEEKAAEVICRHINMGQMRSYQQDPHFGLTVLSEIGSKALSPGINDPGTAIDVFIRQGAILAGYRREDIDPPENPTFDRLWVRPLNAAELLRDAFTAPARDGAAVIEVQERLQQVLAGLLDHPCEDMAEAARSLATLCCARARTALAFGPDRDRLKAATNPDVWSGSESLI